MKLQTDITINGKNYKKGDFVTAWSVYSFLVPFTLITGAASFYMAYWLNDMWVDTLFLYMVYGLSALIFLGLYFVYFAVDEVKWMLINSALGTYGISAQIEWMLEIMGKSASNYQVHIHAVPFMWYVMLTFLLRQSYIDIMNARDNELRLGFVNTLYVVSTASIYTLLHLY